jgi:hypothetical protein
MAETLVETCWLWYRDLLCREAGGAPRLALFSAGDTAAGAPRPRSVEGLFRSLEACREAWHALHGNVSARLTVEVLLGRLAREAA